MPGFKFNLLLISLIFIILYPKFPLFGVSGTFVSIRLEDILIGLLMVIFCCDLLRQRLSLFKDSLPRAIILYWAVCLTATFFGVFVIKTASLNMGMLHTLRRIEYMSLFFMAYSWLKTISQLKFFTKTLIVMSVLVAIYGLGQQFLSFPIISTNNSEFSKGLALTLGPGARINSTFAGHYDLAAFCVLPLLFIAAFFPSSRQKPLLFIIGCLIYWTMLLSASRITFVSSIISMGCLLLIIKKRSWLIPLFIISIIGVVVSPQLRGRYMELITNHLHFSLAQSVSASVASDSAYAVDQIPDALKSPPVPEDRSFNIRLQAEWPRALRAFYKNPVLGSGFSSIGLAVDNEYLRTAAETGVLGLLALGLIILRFSKSSLPYILHYEPKFKNTFIVVSFCFLLSLLLGSIFIDLFTASKIAMSLWAIIGLAEKVKKLHV